MFKGFYNLASGMITQGRHMDVISNNMTNVATNGFKADRFTASTFQDVMWYLTGNKNKNYTDLGNMSWITAPSQLYTDFTPGAPEETGLPLDFMIMGDGFFSIQTEAGQRYYTRNGSFSLDNEGYLWLSGYGRVLNNYGQPMFLGTDKLYVDDHGELYTEKIVTEDEDGEYTVEGGDFLGQIGVWAFADNGALTKNELGFFEGGAPIPVENARIYNGFIERSNCDMVQLMSELIATQRSYQSSAEAIKIYDQLMRQASDEVGKM